jgi:hypothetical protein
MKVRCNLWVRLKVVDLVVQTAWMTLTEKLDLGGELVGLARYAFWRIELDGSDAERILADVDRVIRMDSAFTNQNKHVYLLEVEGGPSAGGLALGEDYPLMTEEQDREGTFAVDCLVREITTALEEGYRDRLNARLESAQVTDLVAGEVWRILVRAGSERDAVEKVEALAVTRSRRQGLLLNPHYQRFEILAARPSG